MKPGTTSWVIKNAYNRWGRMPISVLIKDFILFLQASVVRNTAPKRKRCVNDKEPRRYTYWTYIERSQPPFSEDAISSLYGGIEATAARTVITNLSITYSTGYIASVILLLVDIKTSPPGQTHTTRPLLLYLENWGHKSKRGERAP